MFVGADNPRSSSAFVVSGFVCQHSCSGFFFIEVFLYKLLELWSFDSEEQFNILKGIVLSVGGVLGCVIILLYEYEKIMKIINRTFVKKNGTRSIFFDKSSIFVVQCNYLEVEH